MSDETCECGAPWPCFCGASKPYVQENATETSTMDYIKSEAERLPGGTAARALAAMNGSAGARWMDDPELPSQILFTPIVSTPDTPPSATELDPDARFVTITISREAAKDLAERAGQWAVVSKPFADACRAALEADNA
jgi:hypothetical protein